MRLMQAAEISYKELDSEDKYQEPLNEKGAHGGVVVKALRYKPAGRGFDSRWCH